jgi:hypothetical protein
MPGDGLLMVAATASLDDSGTLCGTMRSWRPTSGHSIESVDRSIDLVPEKYSGEAIRLGRAKPRVACTTL